MFTGTWGCWRKPCYLLLYSGLYPPFWAQVSVTRCRNFNTNQFWLGFIMVAYEKIYFEAYTNDQYISHKNNIAQLYFILGRAELHWNFSSWLRDASDIHRFPALHMVNTHFMLENLWISKLSLCILEKFQRSSALPNIKYNCAILLCEMYRSFVYALQYFFS